MKNFMLNEHLTITHKKCKNGYTRVEVKSQLLKDEPIYDDLTLDSEMAIHYDNQLRHLLNDLS